jgi:ribose transport system ATP-binding protein
VIQSTDSAPLLEARGICKSFPGVRALEEVSLRLNRGEVLAVIGENGAGKTTLMNILSGVLVPDSGEISLDGRVVELRRVEEAQGHGIVLIHQELNLAENLDVAGNIFLGREPTWGGPLGFLQARIYEDAARITRQLGLDCSTRTRVVDLSLGQRQLVEIARALSLRSRILIMDEPTSSLTQRETDRLFQVIHDLRRQGVSLLYISHRLKEVEASADRVIVLRDGRNAGELQRGEINHDAMVRRMVGREAKQFFQRTFERSDDAPKHQPVLQVRGLRWSPRQNLPIELEVRAGEIVGLSGLMGAGRTEFAEVLFGLRPKLAGQVLLDGRRVSIKTPTDAINEGIFLIPEDRRLQGLVLEAGVRENISLPSLDRLNWMRLVAFRRERELAQSICRQLNIRTPSIKQTAGLLSGGNQQKVVLGKWLTRTPRILILDEPTRGIDVGTKSEVYALMDRLAKQGVALLMISSDLEEILGISDRVIVMHDGQVAGEFDRKSFSEEAIMNLATGGKNQP